MASRSRSTARRTRSGKSTSTPSPSSLTIPFQSPHSSVDSNAAAPNATSLTSPHPSSTTAGNNPSLTSTSLSSSSSSYSSSSSSSSSSAKRFRTLTGEFEFGNDHDNAAADSETPKSKHPRLGVAMGHVPESTSITSGSTATTKAADGQYNDPPSSSSRSPIVSRSPKEIKQKVYYDLQSKVSQLENAPFELEPMNEQKMKSILVEDPNGSLAAVLHVLNQRTGPQKWIHSIQLIHATQIISVPADTVEMMVKRIHSELSSCLAIALSKYLILDPTKQKEMMKYCISIECLMGSNELKKYVDDQQSDAPKLKFDDFKQKLDTFFTRVQHAESIKSGTLNLKGCDLQSDEMDDLIMSDSNEENINFCLSRIEHRLRTLDGGVIIAALNNAQDIKMDDIVALTDRAIRLKRGDPNELKSQASYAEQHPLRAQWDGMTQATLTEERNKENIGVMKYTPGTLGKRKGIIRYHDMTEFKCASDAQVYSVHGAPSAMMTWKAMMVALMKATGKENVSQIYDLIRTGLTMKNGFMIDVNEAHFGVFNYSFLPAAMDKPHGPVAKLHYACHELSLKSSLLDEHKTWFGSYAPSICLDLILNCGVFYMPGLTLNDPHVISYIPLSDQMWAVILYLVGVHEQFRWHLIQSWRDKELRRSRLNQSHLLPVIEIDRKNSNKNVMYQNKNPRFILHKDTPSQQLYCIIDNGIPHHAVRSLTIFEMRFLIGPKSTTSKVLTRATARERAGEQINRDIHPHESLSTSPLSHVRTGPLPLSSKSAPPQAKTQSNGTNAAAAATNNRSSSRHELGDRKGDKKEKEVEEDADDDDEEGHDQGSSTSSDDDDEEGEEEENGHGAKSARGIKSIISSTTRAGTQANSAGEKRQRVRGRSKASTPMNLKKRKSPSAGGSRTRNRNDIKLKAKASHLHSAPLKPKLPKKDEVEQKEQGTENQGSHELNSKAENRSLCIGDEKFSTETIPLLQEAIKRRDQFLEIGTVFDHVIVLLSDTKYSKNVTLIDPVTQPEDLIHSLRKPGIVIFHPNIPTDHLAWGNIQAALSKGFLDQIGIALEGKKRGRTKRAPKKKAKSSSMASSSHAAAANTGPAGRLHTSVSDKGVVYLHSDMSVIEEDSLQQCRALLASINSVPPDTTAGGSVRSVSPNPNVNAVNSSFSSPAASSSNLPSESKVGCVRIPSTSLDMHHQSLSSSWPSDRMAAIASFKERAKHSNIVIGIDADPNNQRLFRHLFRSWNGVNLDFNDEQLTPTLFKQLKSFIDAGGQIMIGLQGARDIVYFNRVAHAVLKCPGLASLAYDIQTEDDVMKSYDSAADWCCQILDHLHDPTVTSILRAPALRLPTSVHGVECTPRLAWCYVPYVQLVLGNDPRNLFFLRVYSTLRIKPQLVSKDVLNKLASMFMNIDLLLKDSAQLNVYCQTQTYPTWTMNGHEFRYGPQQYKQFLGVVQKIIDAARGTMADGTNGEITPTTMPIMTAADCQAIDEYCANVFVNTNIKDLQKEQFEWFDKDRQLQQKAGLQKDEDLNKKLFIPLLPEMKFRLEVVGYADIEQGYEYNHGPVPWLKSFHEVKKRSQSENAFYYNIDIKKILESEEFKDKDEWIHRLVFLTFGGYSHGVLHQGDGPGAHAPTASVAFVGFDVEGIDHDSSDANVSVRQASTTMSTSSKAASPWRPRYYLISLHHDTWLECAMNIAIPLDNFTLSKFPQSLQDLIKKHSEQSMNEMNIDVGKRVKLEDISSTLSISSATPSTSTSTSTSAAATTGPLGASLSRPTSSDEMKSLINKFNQWVGKLSVSSKRDAGNSTALSPCNLSDPTKSDTTFFRVILEQPAGLRSKLTLSMSKQQQENGHMHGIVHVPNEHRRRNESGNTNIDNIDSIYQSILTAMTRTCSPSLRGAACQPESRNKESALIRDLENILKAQIVSFTKPNELLQLFANLVNSPIHIWKADSKLWCPSFLSQHSVPLQYSTSVVPTNPPGLQPVKGLKEIIANEIHLVLEVTYDQTNEATGYHLWAIQQAPPLSYATEQFQALWESIAIQDTTAVLSQAQRQRNSFASRGTSTELNEPIEVEWVVGDKRMRGSCNVLYDEHDVSTQTRLIRAISRGMLTLETTSLSRKSSQSSSSSSSAPNSNSMSLAALIQRLTPIIEQLQVISLIGGGSQGTGTCIDSQDIINTLTKISDGVIQVVRYVFKGNHEEFLNRVPKNAPRLIHMAMESNSKVGNHPITTTRTPLVISLLYINGISSSHSSLSSSSPLPTSHSNHGQFQESYYYAICHVQDVPSQSVQSQSDTHQQSPSNPLLESQSSQSISISTSSISCIPSTFPSPLLESSASASPAILDPLPAIRTLSSTSVFSLTPPESASLSFSSSSAGLMAIDTVASEGARYCQSTSHDDGDTIASIGLSQDTQFGGLVPELLSSNSTSGAADTSLSTSTSISVDEVLGSTIMPISIDPRRRVSLSCGPNRSEPILIEDQDIDCNDGNNGIPFASCSTGLSSQVGQHPPPNDWKPPFLPNHSKTSKWKLKLTLKQNIPHVGKWTDLRIGLGKISARVAATADYLTQGMSRRFSTLANGECGLYVTLCLMGCWIPFGCPVTMDELVKSHPRALKTLLDKKFPSPAVAKGSQAPHSNSSSSSNSQSSLSASLQSLSISSSAAAATLIAAVNKVKNALQFDHDQNVNQGFELKDYAAVDMAIRDLIILLAPWEKVEDVLSRGRSPKPKDSSPDPVFISSIQEYQRLSLTGDLNDIQGLISLPSCCERLRDIILAMYRFVFPRRKCPTNNGTLLDPTKAVGHRRQSTEVDMILLSFFLQQPLLIVVGDIPSLSANLVCIKEANWGAYGWNLVKLASSELTVAVKGSARSPLPSFDATWIDAFGTTITSLKLPHCEHIPVITNCNLLPFDYDVHGRETAESLKKSVLHWEFYDRDTMNHPYPPLKLPMREGKDEDSEDLLSPSTSPPSIGPSEPERDAHGHGPLWPGIIPNAEEHSRSHQWLVNQLAVMDDNKWKVEVVSALGDGLCWFHSLRAALKLKNIHIPRIDYFLQMFHEQAILFKRYHYRYLHGKTNKHDYEYRLVQLHRLIEITGRKEYQEEAKRRELGDSDAKGSILHSRGWPGWPAVDWCSLACNILRIPIVLITATPREGRPLSFYHPGHPRAMLGEPHSVIASQLPPSRTQMEKLFQYSVLHPDSLILHFLGSHFDCLQISSTRFR